MKVLVVDDQILFRECLVQAIDSQPDFSIIGQTGSIEEGIALSISLRPDIVLLGTDSSLDPGLKAIEAILYSRPEAKVVILTINESDESLFTAIRYGAKGYIRKDFPLEHLLASLRGLGRNEAAVSRLMTSHILQEFSRLGKIVGTENRTDLDKLTTREIEVLKQLGREASNEEIAERLMISYNTAKVHVSHILKKLNLRNRHEASSFAHRHGIAASRTDPSSMILRKK